MKALVCEVCGGVYDPSLRSSKMGIAANTAFADLPLDGQWLLRRR